MKLTIWLCAIMLFPTLALAEAGEIYLEPGSNVAVGGYDTVAYFTEGEAIQGTDTFKTMYKGSVWKFSTQEHLDLFTENPEHYAPQYGGHCAYATSNNVIARGDPKQ